MRRAALVLGLVWLGYLLGWCGRWAGEEAGFPDPFGIAAYQRGRAWVEANLLPAPTPAPLTWNVSSGALLTVVGDPFPPSSSHIAFHTEVGEVARINSNGSVTIPAGVPLDSAGRGFWRAVERLAPRCP